MPEIQMPHRQVIHESPHQIYIQDDRWKDLLGSPATGVSFFETITQTQHRSNTGVGKPCVGDFALCFLSNAPQHVLSRKFGLEVKARPVSASQHKHAVSTTRLQHSKLAIPTIKEPPPHQTRLAVRDAIQEAAEGVQRTCAMAPWWLVQPSSAS